MKIVRLRRKKKEQAAKEVGSMNLMDHLKQAMSSRRKFIEDDDDNEKEKKKEPSVPSFSEETNKKSELLEDEVDFGSDNDEWDT